MSTISRYAIYSLLIFSPLARGSVQPWAITTVHLITLGALTALLLEKNLSGAWHWIKTPLDKQIGCLLLLCLLSSVFSLHHRTSCLATVLLLNYFAVFYIIVHTIRTESQWRQLLYVVIGVAVFLSIFGIIKRLGHNPFPWWHYPEINESLRLNATFGNADHLAGYMEMALALLLGLFLTGFWEKKPFLIVLLVFLLVLALMLSLSRGGWVSAFSGVVFMGGVVFFNPRLATKRLARVVCCGLIMVIVILLSSAGVVERTNDLRQWRDIPNFRARVAVWGGISEMIKDYPLLGTGPGTFAVVFTQYQPAGYASRYFFGHNDYLHFTSEVGLPLMGLVAWALFALYKKGFLKLKSPSRLVRGMSVGAMSGIAAILVHSIADFNLHIPANALLFSVLCAIVAAPAPNQNRPMQEL